MQKSSKCQQVMSKFRKSGRLYTHRENVFSRRFTSFPVDWYIFVVNDFWPTYNVHRNFSLKKSIRVDNRVEQWHLHFTSPSPFPSPNDSDHAKCEGVLLRLRLSVFPYFHFCLGPNGHISKRPITQQLDSAIFWDFQGL